MLHNQRQCELDLFVNKYERSLWNYDQLRLEMTDEGVGMIQIESWELGHGKKREGKTD